MTIAWTSEHFVGGHPALDLVNTVYDRIAPAEGNELLATPEDLEAWLVAQHLTGGQAGLHQDAAVAVRTTRERAHDVLGAVARGAPPDPTALGRLLATAGTALEAGTVEPPATLVDNGGVDGMLALLVIQAFFTLPHDRIGACPSCGWLFLDTSRSGRRRWCSMRTCGNRDKVARHRHRQVTDIPDPGSGVAQRL